MWRRRCSRSVVWGARWRGWRMDGKNAGKGKRRKFRAIWGRVWQSPGAVLGRTPSVFPWPAPRRHGVQARTGGPRHPAGRQARVRGRRRAGPGVSGAPHIPAAAARGAERPPPGGAAPAQRQEQRAQRAPPGGRLAACRATAPPRAPASPHLRTPAAHRRRRRRRRRAPTAPPGDALCGVERGAGQGEARQGPGRGREGRRPPRGPSRRRRPVCPAARARLHTAHAARPRPQAFLDARGGDYDDCGSFEQLVRRPRGAGFRSLLWPQRGSSGGGPWSQGRASMYRWGHGSLAPALPAAPRRAAPRRRSRGRWRRR
jgi:hypothetical protein